jgi:F-type H+-transporting ATPase subunit delta
VTEGKSGCPKGARARTGPDGERVDVSETASISTGIAGRYAAAMFELARDEGAMPRLEADVDTLEAALKESADLRRLISSPLYSREETGRAIDAIAAATGLSPSFRNLLALMAQNRRLFVLPQLVTRLRAMIAEAKGEVTAEVTSAKALTKAQSERLAGVLSAGAGKDVKIVATVDESLIGGLVVKIGSKMIDTSIRSRLMALQNTMKEVG